MAKLSGSSLKSTLLGQSNRVHRRPLTVPYNTGADEKRVLVSAPEAIDFRPHIYLDESFPSLFEVRMLA